jgi:hypothetical protein
VTVRELLDAEREEARELFAQMRPAGIRERLHRAPPADDPGGDADAATLRERIEVEKAEARELFARMEPRRVAERLPAPPGPNPLVLVLACLALGIALARLLDWRGHAHPRR